MSLLPLSRLFVSLLLSKQAVTLIPFWLSKGHTYKCTSTNTRGDTQLCGLSPWGCSEDRLKEDRHAGWSHCSVYGGWRTNGHFVRVWTVVCVCNRVWMRLTVMKQNEKDESTVCVLAFSCLCALVYICPYCHPAAYQSSSLCLTVCIDLLPVSLTLWAIHASVGQRDDLCHYEGNVTAITCKTDTMCLADTVGLPPSMWGESREMQADRLKVWRCYASLIYQ